MNFILRTRNALAFGWGVLLLSVVTLGLTGCDAVPWQDDGLAPGDTDEETIQIEGTVRYLELEGGFWAIEGVDETTYDPVNLPEAYQEEGLAVRVQAVVREDLASIHMVGPIIEIRAIEKR